MVFINIEIFSVYVRPMCVGTYNVIIGWIIMLYSKTCNFDQDDAFKVGTLNGFNAIEFCIDSRAKNFG